MGHALQANHNIADVLPHGLRHLQPAADAQERIPRLHHKAGHGGGRGARQQRPGDGRAGGQTPRRVHLQLQRGEEREDFLAEPRRHSVHPSAAQRRHKRQGRLLEQVQARRGNVQVAAARQRARPAGARRLRRHLGAAHCHGERRQDLPRAQRIHG